MTGIADLSWPIRTERLSIRPATAEDVDATWRIRREPSVAMWIPSAGTDREEYAAMFVEPDRLGKLLVVERDGEVIGDLMLAVESPWAQVEVRDQAADVQAELGWSLHPSEEGNGYATEAVRELLRICFEELGLRRVVANCFSDNVGSWRLMERLGMRREAHNVKDSLHRSGEWLDGFTYALLADEWSGKASESRRPGSS